MKVMLRKGKTMLEACLVMALLLLGASASCRYSPAYSGYTGTFFSQAQPHTQLFISKIDAAREYMRCETDPKHFIFNYCKTLDNNDNKIKLIPRYKYLEDYIDELHAGKKNLLVEKTRQMTISWATMAYELWAISFKDNWNAINISKKEDYVDDGGSRNTKNSLHGKIRFMYTRLPSHLKHNIVFTHLKIENAARCSVIKGESSNTDAGRSTDTSFACVDEAAHIDNGELIYEALKLSAKGKIVLVSTPNGMNNFFARIRFDAASDYKILSLHWRLHPDRNEAWYIAQCKSMTPLQIARQLDISYENSIAGRVFTWDNKKNLRAYNEKLIREKIKNKTIYSGMDFGMADPTALGLHFFEGEALVCFDEHIEAGKTPAEHAAIIQAKRKFWGINDKSHIIFGDPAGMATSQLVRSTLFAEYAANGIHILKGDNAVLPGITRLSTMLKAGTLVFYDNCVKHINAIKMAAYPVDKFDNPRKECYAHDIHSHPLDGLRYLTGGARPEGTSKTDWSQAEPEPTEYT